MIVDIDIFVNDTLVKTYLRDGDDVTILPRVGEYIMLSSDELELEDIEEAQIENEFDDEGYIEVLVTKIVHDLDGDNVFIHTQTKHKRTKEVRR